MKQKFASLLQRIARPGILRDVAMISSGSATSQAIVILSSPFLMRLYGPEDLGIYSISISLLLIGIASLRFNQAIPLPATHAEAAVIAQLALLTLLMTTAVVAALFLLLSETITVLTKTPAITHVIWMLPVIFLFAGMAEILLSVSLRMKRFKVLGYAQIAQSAVQVLFQTLAGLHDPSAQQLLIGTMVGNGAAVIVYAIALHPEWHAIRRHIRSITRMQLWQTAKQYRHFPLLATPSQLVNLVPTQITPVLLAAFYSANVVGWLALAQRAVGIPVAVIGYGVSQVFFQRSAQLHNQSLGDLLALYKKATRFLLLVSVVPIALIALTGPMLFGFIFGDQWTESGWYVSILAPVFICQVAVSPLSQIMAVIGAQKLQLVWDIVRLALVSGSILAGAWLQVSADLCIMLYGLGMSASYIWLYWLTVSAIKRRVLITANQAIP